MCVSLLYPFHCKRRATSSSRPEDGAKPLIIQNIYCRPVAAAGPDFHDKFILIYKSLYS
jgi:hypothetical protein